MKPSEAIELLRLSGLTESAIGAGVGVRQSTINRIRKGRMQPAWAVGNALIEWAKASASITACEKVPKEPLIFGPPTDRKEYRNVRNTMHG